MARRKLGNKTFYKPRLVPLSRLKTRAAGVNEGSTHWMGDDECINARALWGLNIRTLCEAQVGFNASFSDNKQCHTHTRSLTGRGGMNGSCLSSIYSCCCPFIMDSQTTFSFALHSFALMICHPTNQRVSVLCVHTGHFYCLWRIPNLRLHKYLLWNKKLYAHTAFSDLESKSKPVRQKLRDLRNNSIPLSPWAKEFVEYAY